MNSQNTLITNQESNLILYPTRFKMFLGFAGSSAFVAAGIWLISFGDVWHIGLGIISPHSAVWENAFLNINYYSLCLFCQLMLKPESERN